MSKERDPKGNQTPKEQKRIVRGQMKRTHPGNGKKK